MAAQNKSITRSEASDVRKKLMRHSFAFWPEKGKGWVLDGSLRFTRERLLLLDDFDLAVRLHRAAYHLYIGWCDDYPKTKETWRPEADYHAAQLKNLAPGEELTK
jgi:hypothetical protein